MSRESSAASPAIPPESIWILGAGHFGRLAAQRLTRRFPHTDFTVVDLREDRLEKVSRELNVRCLWKDSIGHITENPLPEGLWIVPAVPVHVAFLWLTHRLGEEGPVVRLPVPATVDEQVPNPMRVPSGTVYASYATFICPDACSEPDDICSHTRKPRLGILHEHLANISVPDFKVMVVRSHQLAPGVGGYPTQSLQNLLAGARQEPGGYIVATACRCHGVLDCLRWERHAVEKP